MNSILKLNVIFISRRLYLLLTSIILIIVSAMLHGLSEGILERQDNFINTIGVTYDVTDPVFGNISSKEVRRLVDNEFFQTRFTEKESVVLIKESVPYELRDLYFEDVWDLFWYLEFIGDENALFAALSFAISNNVLSETSNCISYQDCNVSSDGVNLNNKNADNLFKLIRRQYIDRALMSYERLSYQEGYYLASDALSLIRSVDIDANSPKRLVDLYNDILVVSSFLTRPIEKVSHDFQKSDYQVLRDLIRSKDLDPEHTFDPLIGDYVQGLETFRSDCFIDASNYFSEKAEMVDHEPIAELFAFMSLRSLSRPFVDRSKLTSSEQDSQIEVIDCSGRFSYSDFMLRFIARMSEYKHKIIQHRGLLSDLEFYEMHFPGNKHDSLTRDRSFIDLAGGSLDFIWPIQGRVIKRFEKGMNDDGVIIESDKSSSVVAAEGGKVIYVGDQIRSLGKMVLIDHGGQILSVYGKLFETSVELGQVVSKGDQVGLTGSVDIEDAAQLFFQIRDNAGPVDPVHIIQDLP